MEDGSIIDVKTFSNWLNEGRKISILDLRPIDEREEWYIPNSIHFDAYEKLKANREDALQGLQLNKDIPVVTICAGGKTSLIAAELLQKQGYEAYSLKDGMKGWSLSWNTAEISFRNFDIIQLRRTGKGCLSYIIASKSEAIVVDASLPVEVYEELIRKHDLKLVFVLETHIHADHLSRSKQLADRFSVPLHLPLQNKVSFDFIPIYNGSILHLGNISIEAFQTPGHTFESTCYLLNNEILFTGDTVFINGLGRPDLKADYTEAIQKSKLLYSSLHRILELADDTIILPAHASEPIMFDNKAIQTTVGDIKNNIPMLRLNEDEFINFILQRIPATPPNYQAIVEKNIKGDFSDVNPVDLEAGANKCAIS
jgi:glyoxylase-like metal-dependent hydrolase (beta-lactamase superfamily II)/rhodanese-related sulfurtransferase